MPFTRAQLEALLIDAAARYGIDPSIAYWQIQAESDFNPNARSHAGAEGIAQFMPPTWGDYGRGSPYDPPAALDAWGRYMRDLLRMFSGDYSAALAGYNWGQGRVRTAINNYGSGWLSRAPAETRNYVSRILSRAQSQPITDDAGETGFIDLLPDLLPDGSPSSGSLALFILLGLGAFLLLTR